MNQFARLALVGALMLAMPAGADAGGFANTHLSASAAGGGTRSGRGQGRAPA